MRWQHPLLLYFLFGVPLLFLIFFYADKTRKKRIELFGSEALQKKSGQSTHSGKRQLKSGLILASVSLLIAALASPQIMSNVKVKKKLGSEFFIVLDVSLSMLAQDENPNRLAKAKEEILALVEKLEGYRLGLIIFAGTSFVQCPLTADSNAIRYFLESVDTQSLPVPGSAFKKAIEQARKSFGEEKGTQKYLIFFTDGEDLEGEDPLPSAREASRKGITFFCVGFGSPVGSPIPLYEKGTMIGYKKDAFGATVVTQLNEKLLSDIAHATHGRYFKSTDAFGEIESILGEVARRGKKELSEESEHQYESRFQVPLFVAFLCLALELAISEKRKVLGCLLFLFLVTTPVFGDEKMLEELVSQGNAFYLKGEFQKAIAAYRDAFLHEMEDSTRAKIHYNLGNTHYRLGELEKSLKEYQEALRLDPGDKDAKHNLEVVLQALQGPSQVEGGAQEEALDEEMKLLLQQLEQAEWGRDPKGIPQPPSGEKPPKEYKKDW